jgi:hypothetical protein
VRRILQSGAMFSAAARRARIKNPVEFAVMFPRALQLAGTTLDSDPPDLAAERMAHLLFEPPSPAGWDDGLAWITEGALSIRLFALRSMPLSRNTAQETISHSAAGTIAFLARRLDLDLSRADLRALVDYANTRVDLDGREVRVPFDERSRDATKIPPLAALLANHPHFQQN